MKKFGWPIAYTHLGSFVQHLHQASAKSLFVDLILTLPRLEDDAFCDFAKEVSSASGMPQGRWLKTVLAVPEDGADYSASGCLERAVKQADTAYIPIAPDSRGLRAESALGRIAKKQRESAGSDQARSMPVLFGVGLEYLNEHDHAPKNAIDAKLAILDRVGLLVPIHVGADTGRGYRLLVDELDFPSPALLMFRDIDCKSLAAPDRCAQFDPSLSAAASVNSADVTDAQRHWAEVTPPDTLYLQWGGLADSRQTQINQQVRSVRNSKAECSDRDSMWSILGVNLLSGSLQGTSLGPDFANARGCPYHLTLPLETIVSSVDGETAAPQPALVELLGDRHVFFGTDIDVLHDRVNVPIRGDIPAVHGHAMALDNLLSASGPYYKLSEDSQQSRWSLVFQFFSVGFLRVCFFTCAKSCKITTRVFLCDTKKYSPPAKWIVRLALVVAIAALVFVLLKLVMVGVTAPVFLIALCLLVLVIRHSCSVFQLEFRNNKDSLFNGYTLLGPHLVVLFLVSVFCFVFELCVMWFLNTPPNNLFGLMLVVTGIYTFVFRREIAQGKNEVGEGSAAAVAVS